MVATDDVEGDDAVVVEDSIAPLSDLRCCLERDGVVDSVGVVSGEVVVGLLPWPSPSWCSSSLGSGRGLDMVVAS